MFSTHIFFTLFLSVQFATKHYLLSSNLFTQPKLAMSVTKRRRFSDLPSSIKNSVENADDLLDMTNWGTTFQEDSILANFNVDCLQLILNRLSLADSYHIALSCRLFFACG